MSVRKVDSRMGVSFVFDALTPKKARCSFLSPIPVETNNGFPQPVSHLMDISVTGGTQNTGTDYLDERLSGIPDVIEQDEFEQQIVPPDSESDPDDVFVSLLCDQVHFSENNLKLAVSIFSCYNCLSDKCRTNFGEKCGEYHEV